MSTQQTPADIRIEGPGADVPGTAVDVRTSGPVAPGEPAVGDLLKRLASDSGDLVRNELALAKLEMRDMARQLAADSAKVGIAIGVALGGGLVLLAAAVLGLGVALGGLGQHYALAALIIGAVMLLVGGLMARSGLAGLKSPPTPDQTVESLQNTRDWAGREAREFKEEIRNA
jgi:hypothetical protein